jgi:hypothetical protein
VETRTIPHQRAHICDARSFGHLCAFGTWSYTLSSCGSFTRQATLVDLKVGSGEDAEISRNAVACGEGDKVTRDNLVRKEVYLFSVADDVTMVRNEFVESLK